MQVWEDRVKEVIHNELTVSTFAAFNTNVDVVVHLTRDNIAGLIDDPQVSMDQVRALDVDELWEISSRNEFVAVVCNALGRGKSSYIVLQNMELLDWLEEKFTTRKESMGGQAGVIANQMAALKANSIVYTSLLSPKQGSMFFPEVEVPVIDNGLHIKSVGESVRPEHNVKVNWIFEYGKNEEFVIDDKVITTPRANRVILATRPEGVVMEFPSQFDNYLPELGSQFDVAFLAGFHYAPTEPEALREYLADSVDSIRRLKQQNKNLRLHFEYVPMSDTEAEKQMLRTIAQEIKSFGINENEVKRVLDEFGFTELCQEIACNERAFCLYRGARKLMETLGFERIQLHNLGYYVVVLKKPYPISPKQVREACLYASSVNAIKAKYGGYVVPEKLWEAESIGLSDIGINQLHKFAEEMREHGFNIPDDFETEGIADLGDHYVLVIPAHVVPNPVSTVGMGDTISSSAFAYEWNPQRIILE